MKTQSVVNVRLAEDKERLLLNFVFSLWFEKEREKVNAGNNTKKKKRYAQLDPFKMVVEPPVVFKADYFLACAADRPGGTLLIDKPVPYLTLDTFLEKSKVSSKVDEGGNFNQTLFTAVKEKTLTLDLLRELIESKDNLSTDPIYYLTKLYPNKDEETDTPIPTAADDQTSDENDGTEEDENETEKDDGEYFVIFDSQEGTIDFEALVSWIFRDYTFESIELEATEKGDETFPTKKPSVDDPTSFYTGTVTLKDSTFKEKSFVFNFIDLNALADLVSSIEDVTIIEVAPPVVSKNNPSDEEKTIGKGTVITTSAKVADDDVVLEKLVDDLGNDLTENSQLVITSNDKTTVTAEIKVKEFDFAWAFRYGDNQERRRVNATFDLKNQPDTKADTTIGVDYNLDADSITPVVEGFDSTKGMGKSTLDLSFLDKDNNPIPYVVPQTLGKSYKMFDSDDSVLYFEGTETTLATTESGEVLPNILRMNVQLTKYGKVKFYFADAALKKPTYDIIDPWVEYSVKLVSQDFTSGKLTLKYDILQNKTVIELDTKSFTENGIPYITIDGNKFTPTTTWDKQGFTNVYELGQVPREENLEVSGEVSLGGNRILVNFSDVVPVAPDAEVPSDITITDLVLNGGSIYPSTSNVTENVLNGSIVIVSQENAIVGTDLKLVSLTDALGEDITSKAEVTFTALNAENTQFALNVTLNDYQWPMSFDDQGSNGKLKVKVQIRDVTASAKEGETSYKLNYSYEAITPKVLNSQLTNNSLNNAKIFVGFIDADGNAFKTGLEQTIALNPPMFGNDEVTYIGKPITYGEDDDGRFGAFIPVNFKRFGNFTLSFADTAFKAVNSSVADPTASYKLRYYDEKFIDNGDFTIRFALYGSSGLITMNDGNPSTNGITLSINNEPVTINNLVWDTAPAISTTLVVQATLPESVDKSNFDIEISGQWLIGTNNVGVNVSYSGTHTNV